MKLFRPTILLAGEIRADLNRKVQSRWVAAALDCCIRAARLRQSILKRVFEGKLVPQDPHDEPSSVLLERIRSQRAGEPGKLGGPVARQARQGRKRAVQENDSEILR